MPVLYRLRVDTQDKSRIMTDYPASVTKLRKILPQFE